MARLLFNIWAFAAMKFAQRHNKFAKVGSKICQVQNRPYNKLPKTFKISPNLVTLVTYPFAKNYVLNYYRTFRGIGPRRVN